MHTTMLPDQWVNEVCKRAYVIHWVCVTTLLVCMCILCTGIWATLVSRKCACQLLTSEYTSPTTHTLSTRNTRNTHTFVYSQSCWWGLKSHPAFPCPGRLRVVSHVSPYFSVSPENQNSWCVRLGWGCLADGGQSGLPLSLHPAQIMLMKEIW